MKKKDIHKELRNSLDVSLEDKFMTNLKWSMLFFCFKLKVFSVFSNNSLSVIEIFNQYSIIVLCLIE